MNPFTHLFYFLTVLVSLFSGISYGQINQVYGELKEEQDNSYHVTAAGKLYFKYEEKYASEGALSYKIYNYKREALTTPVVNKKIGMNFIELNLSASGLASGTSYLLEVSSGRGEKKYLRFKYIP